MKRSLSTCAAVAIVVWFATASNVLAQCQGFGTATPGGADKPVYHVTNLGDSGTGTLRDALSHGNRNVVFDVAGEIVLAGDIKVRGAFLTVDGFTAPSPGITLRNYGIRIRGTLGAHDVVVKAIRTRNAALDGFDVSREAYNVVLDHVSAHGSGDGNLDITSDVHDVTVCWSIFAEPAGPQKNSLIKYNPYRITLHHNLFTRAVQRNPQVRVDDLGTPATQTTLDMRNNLVWDWGDGYGTLIWFGPWVNAVNNFYFGPLAPTKALLVRDGARAYTAGNFSLDGVDLDHAGTEAEPFAAPPVTTTGACDAAHAIVAYAGVRPLDMVDEGFVNAIQGLPSCQ